MREKPATPHPTKLQITQEVTLTENQYLSQNQDASAENCENNLSGFPHQQELSTGEPRRWPQAQHTERLHSPCCVRHSEGCLEATCFLPAGM